ncbi:MAG TPA: decarboxylase, partial [Candidatus Angelobacter sp.]
MSTAINEANVRLDQFFTVAEARQDRWRRLLTAARAWEAAGKQDALGAVTDKKRSSMVNSFSELRQWESFFAYPGPALLKIVEDRITQGDAAGSARLIQSISAALLTHSYRTNAADWEGGEIFAGSMSDKLPIASDGNAPHRPYFEVLIATAAFPSTWSGLREEFRKLRRTQDTFIYETVFVGNFEDAVLGTILNGSLEAVIISEGIPFASVNNSPLLREFLSTHLAAAGIGTDFSELSLSLAQALKLVRPELDIYLLSDREVEKVAGDPGADCFRRI